jgi:hypothetical protein
MRDSISARFLEMLSKGELAVNCLNSVLEGIASKPEEITLPEAPANMSAVSPFVTTTKGIWYDSSSLEAARDGRCRVTRDPGPYFIIIQALPDNDTLKSTLMSACL